MENITFIFLKNTKIDIKFDETLHFTKTLR